MKKEGMHFLETLFELLQNPLYTKILGWKSSGDNFEIRNTDLFIKIVLPRFYEDETYETFLSRLASFRFKKHVDDTGSQSFSHPLFIRGNKSLISMILETEIAADMESGYSRKQGSAFLEKLYDILEDSSYEDYICWCADGTTVLVKKVEEFSQIVLPKFYKHNNFQSFVRQLNMYSFNKTSHDANWREFKQPLFRKGMRNLLGFISRKTQQKNSSANTASSVDSTSTADMKTRQSSASGHMSTDQESVGSGTGSDTSMRKVRSEDMKPVYSQAPHGHSVPVPGVQTQMLKNGTTLSGSEASEIATLRNDMMVLQSRVTTLEGQMQYVFSCMQSNCTGGSTALKRPSYVPFSQTHEPHTRHHVIGGNHDSKPDPTRYRDSKTALSALSSGDESPEESNSVTAQSSVSSGSDSSGPNSIQKAYSLSDISSSSANPYKGSVGAFVRAQSVAGAPCRMEGVRLKQRNRTVSTGYDNFESEYVSSAIGEDYDKAHYCHRSGKQGVDAILSAAEGLVRVSHSIQSPQKQLLTEGMGLSEKNFNSRRRDDSSGAGEPYMKRMRSTSEVTVSSSSSGGSSASQYEGRYLSKMATHGK